MSLAPLDLVSADTWYRVTFTVFSLRLYFFEAIALDSLTRGSDDPRTTWRACSLVQIVTWSPHPRIRAGPKGANTRPYDLSFKTLRGRKRQEPALCVGWECPEKSRAVKEFGAPSSKTRVVASRLE